MPDPTAVTALVRALIEAEVPELPPGDERALRLLRYALRILGSSMPSALPSASQSAELARRRLVHAGRTEDALALSRRLRALEACPGARNLPCVLHLLTCLMQSPPPGSLAAFARGSLLERTGGRAIESGGASRPSRAAVPLPSRRAPSCSDGIGRADASALQHAAAAAAASGGAAATSASAAPARTGWRAGAGSGGVVGEEALVRDLLYVMQNIEGRHLKWDDKADSFLFQPAERPRGGPPLPQLTPAAAAAAASLAPGVVQAAELSEWLRLLAVLESQRLQGLSLQLPACLSLLQLLVWGEPPLQRFVTLVAVVRGCSHLRGGAMTVGVERLGQHGDPAVEAYVQRLLRGACAPLLESLREFFIEARPAPLAELWEKRYALRPHMLPCFLSPKAASRALLGGKAINFIRLACGEGQWTFDAAAAAARGGAAAAAAGRHFGAAFEPRTVNLAERAAGEATLSAAIECACSRANEKLVELLLGRHRLQEHLTHLKEYLLLGKGDFVQALMEPLLPQLSRPASQLHRHHLLGLVESAVRSCTSPGVAAGSGNVGSSGGGSGWARGGSDSEQLLLLAHLGVLLSSSPGATGWEAFSLDYRADPPVSAVLSAAAVGEYRRVFTLLWRLKRVELSLSAVWRRHTTAARLVRALSSDALLHRCHLLRHEMVHFVFNLQYYLMFEVIQCSWEELVAALAAASDLDGLIGAHSAFLSAVVQKAMLGPENAPLLEALDALFETILRFAKSQELLYIHLLEQRAAAKQMAAAAAANTAAGGWGAAGAAEAEALLAEGDAPPLQPHFYEQLRVHAAQYRQQFAAFFAQVTRHASLDLTFLSFRLDFNAYYESLGGA
ncbi:hypothetical protein EMIHUDRAFT_460965 [Emiliania huxleyi CCMP1516]|uniref:Spindle pole body component n=3 Tax=Emiliania huxleyi TaxID=2903 RepID=A0A0D3L112_EMIH1|nr:hypothetical protein EMIHUDRAFT_460965 [Emiliania huxleyi CCMP1516]EOD41697.1 hypothetical protein EMIHUDRAFT_460965 [Emiliania huxleyi CCMP1516]|eukprot:XP_005794126.1 hypothetical protein EMIHUDRAFT_460965 [Emiliania huxleyi CCMP1516]